MRRGGRGESARARLGGGALGRLATWDADADLESSNSLPAAAPGLSELLPPPSSTYGGVPLPERGSGGYGGDVGSGGSIGGSGLGASASNGGSYGCAGDGGVGSCVHSSGGFGWPLSPSPGPFPSPGLEPAGPPLQPGSATPGLPPLRDPPGRSQCGSWGGSSGEVRESGGQQSGKESGSLPMSSGWVSLRDANPEPTSCLSPLSAEGQMPSSLLHAGSPGLTQRSLSGWQQREAGSCSNSQPGPLSRSISLVSDSFSELSGHLLSDLPPPIELLSESLNELGHVAGAGISEVVATGLTGLSDGVAGLSSFL
ncbi:hypothetical protein T492DRAFT_835856 [Pavlovales sp. CCMP2436]|nr:hypothetical protein T492DRAFT_835856 [Pavlovales sp. CCMP2436]